MTEEPQPPTMEAPAALEAPLGRSVEYAPGRSLRRYILWYTLVSVAITAVWGGAGAILIPNQVQDLVFNTIFLGGDAHVNLAQLTNLKAAVSAGTATATPDQSRLIGLLTAFDAARVTALALVTSVGTIGTLIAQPLVGVLSDRTRSRLGRRAPWILYGGLLGAMLVAALRYAPSIAILVVLWTLTSIVLNASMTPMMATVADRVPEDRLGTASAMGGLGNFLGGILGGALAGGLFAVIGLDFYFVLAAFVAVAVVLFVALNRDRSSTGGVREPLNWKAFLLGFLVPLRDRDFRWVWISRVFLLFGFTISTALSLYMLQSFVRPALTQAQASATAPLLTVAGLPFTIVTLIIAGRLSDKTGRRKLFVIIAGALMALSMIIPLLSPTIPALFAQSVLACIAFGIFLPVDQALFVDVLPDRTGSAGRDLGIAAMATNIGQALAPILAAQIVVLTGGYQMVWAAGLVLAAIAALAMLRVKRAR
jgi:MFS family permease